MFSKYAIFARTRQPQPAEQPSLLLPPPLATSSVVYLCPFLSSNQPDFPSSPAPKITDVLANAAKNELDFLEHASNGRASQQKVRNRYGW